MKLYMFLPFRDDSQIEKSIINVDPTFGGGGILLRRLYFTSKIIEF